MSHKPGPMRLGYPPEGGVALPTGATTVDLFNSVTAGMRAGMSTYGMQKLRLNLQNSQAGDLTLSESKDGGVTWTQVATDAVALVASPATTYNHFEWLIGYFKDIRLQWTNGGVNQTVFEVDMMLDDDVSAPT